MEIATLTASGLSRSAFLDSPFKALSLEVMVLFLSSNTRAIQKLQRSISRDIRYPEIYHQLQLFPKVHQSPAVRLAVWLLSIQLRWIPVLAQQPGNQRKRARLREQLWICIREAEKGGFGGKLGVLVREEQSLRRVSIFLPDPLYG